MPAPRISSFALPAALLIFGGPLRAQWVRTAGPQGGYIHAMAVKDGYLFAATDESVYRSGDSGATWSLSSPGFPLARVTGLIASGKYLLARKEHGIPLYRSEDLGARWERADEGLPPSGIRDMVAIGSSLLAVNQDGAYRSDDQGGSWARVGTPNQAIFLAADGQAAYAGSFGGGAYRTLDTGRTWTALQSGLGQERVGTLFADQGRVYAVLYDQGVYVSSDRGDTWKLANGQGGYTLFAAHGGALYGVNDGLYRSPDQGATWIKTNSRIAYRSIRCLAAMGNRLFAGTDGYGVFLASETDSGWVDRNAGLVATAPNALAAADGWLYAGGLGMGISRSRDSGRSWKRDESLFSIATHVTLDKLGEVTFLGTNSVGVLRSVDKGESWKQANSGLGYHAISALVHTGSILYAGTAGDGIFRSLDSGTTWRKTTTWVMRPDGLTGAVVYRMAARGPVVFAATGAGMFRSADSGVGWTPINQGFSDSGRVRALATQGSRLFAAAPQGIWRTSDDGASWTLAWAALPLFVYTVAAGDSDLYAGALEGVFRSRDGGDTWFAVNEGMHARNVQSLVFADGSLFAGVAGSGVWRRSLADLSAGILERERKAVDRRAAPGAARKAGSAGSRKGFQVERPGRRVVEVDGLGKVLSP